MEKVMNGIDVFFVALMDYLKTISQQTLNISAIVVLHSIFIPTTIAYLTGITEKLPNIDSVLLVLVALTIMSISSLIRKDMLAIFTHMAGFITQLALLSMVIFK